MQTLLQLASMFSVLDCVRRTYTAWQSTSDERQTEDLCRCTVAPDGACCTHCCLLYRGGWSSHGCNEFLCAWHQTPDGVCLPFDYLFIFIWMLLFVCLLQTLVVVTAVNIIITELGLGFNIIKKNYNATVSAVTPIKCWDNLSAVFFIIHI